MRRSIPAGSTSVTIPIWVQDTSSTTGAGLGSLTHETSGLTAAYRREGGSWVEFDLCASMGLGTYTDITTTGTGGGWVANGSVAGKYEVSIPDAAFEAGARWVEFAFYGAANMLHVPLDYQLEPVPSVLLMEESQAVYAVTLTGDSWGVLYKTGTNDGRDSYANKAGTITLEWNPGTSKWNLTVGVTVYEKLGRGVAGSYVVVGTGGGNMVVSAPKLVVAYDWLEDVHDVPVTLTQANVRTAIGLASANLDTQLSGINAKTTNLPASPAAVGSAMTLAANQHVIVDSGTVTTLTSLPAAPTDWLTAAAVKADAVTKIIADVMAQLIDEVSGLLAIKFGQAAIKQDTEDILEDTGTTIPAAIGTPQQADTAVTLPTTPPTGYGATVDEEAIAEAVALAVITAINETGVAVDPDTVKTAVLSALGTTPTETPQADSVLDLLDTTATGATGAGSVTKNLIVHSVSAAPIDGVAVWITTDSAGNNVVAGTKHTDALGKVTFQLDPGTYYAWRQKSGVNFTNPQMFTVT